jgi:hypothetical protein
VDWQTVGSEDPNDFFRIVDGAPQQGFDGWILNPPLDVSDEYHILPWSVLQEEVEHKLDVGAVWGSAPRSSSRNPGAGRPTQGNAQPLTHGDWQEVPSDPEIVALLRLSSPAVDILEGPSSPFEKPQWVEEFERNRRRLELVGKDGADTLDEWRRQTEERIADLLGRRPWSLLHVLGLLRWFPNDQFFLGEILSR